MKHLAVVVGLLALLSVAQSQEENEEVTTVQPSEEYDGSDSPSVPLDIFIPPLPPVKPPKAPAPQGPIEPLRPPASFDNRFGYPQYNFGNRNIPGFPQPYRGNPNGNGGFFGLPQARQQLGRFGRPGGPIGFFEQFQGFGQPQRPLGFGSQQQLGGPLGTLGLPGNFYNRFGPQQQQGRPLGNYGNQFGPPQTNNFNRLNGVPGYGNSFLQQQQDPFRRFPGYPYGYLKKSQR